MLEDDHNKKCLFIGSRLYKSFWENPSCRTVVSRPPHLREIYETGKTMFDSLYIGFFPTWIQEAAQHVREVLVKACAGLNIRNDFGRGEMLKAFEIAISNYGFFA